MPRKRYSPEEIVTKLRQEDVMMSEGQSIAAAVKAIGVTETTLYRWRSEYGGLKIDQVKRLSGAREGERAAASRGRRSDTRQADPERGGGGKLLSAARRRACVEHVRARLCVSQRRACRALGQHRSTQRKPPAKADDEAALRAAIIDLASGYGRYGYRRITALLRADGWHVNAKQVQRIWRQEGLKVPRKQPRRGRLWLADGSCIRQRPEGPNHVWAYDFVEHRTYEGRRFRMPCILDEFSREALAIEVGRRRAAMDVIETLADLFEARGVPGYIRSNQGPESIAKAARQWIAALGARTGYIEKASP